MNKAQKDVLTRVEQAFGFVPNVLKEMSRVPALVDIYLDATAALAKGSFTPLEQQVIQEAVSAYNECTYSVAVGGAMCKQQGLSDNEIQAIGSRKLPRDKRLANIVSAVWRVMDKRGWLDEADLKELQSGGMAHEQVYEIVGFIALKLVPDYVNHIIKTELDEMFRQTEAA